MKLGNMTLMTGAQILNLRGEKRASDPTLGSLVANQEAWIWYNTTDKVYKYFDGTAIKTFGEGSSPDLSGYVKADGTTAMTGVLELSSADQSAANDVAAVSKGYVSGLLARKLSVSAEGTLAANLSAGGFGISDLAAPVNGTDAARKIDIENALAGLNWQQDVDGMQVDAVLQPQKVEGKRYVLTAVANLHADFGTIDGVVDDVIVEYRDNAFEIVFTPTQDRAEGAIAWNSDTNQYVRFDGNAWANFGGMASVTAGLGLNLNGNELSVKVNAAGGVAVDSDGLNVKLDGASLSKGANGVRVANGGVGFAQLANNIVGSGLTRNTETSTIDLDITAVKSAGFIDADGGTIDHLIFSGEMQEVDGAAATRKFVVDSVATSAKTYVQDNTGGTGEGSTSYTFTHNAGQRFGTVVVLDSTGKQIIPDEITLVDANSLTVTLAQAMKVYIVFVAGANQFVVTP
ncbi:putative T1SS secreted agglutinin RTX [Dickeya phage vB_DsoM_JA33]|uniref:Putative T1SS secreted agglutinin RTX n=2 Tax=Salmondvirus JA11 TaxID=2734141 RepID=A0A386K587_9CAUD|nr:virion structural protein [Dickeya phage vB_DsoM_JA11]AXG67457.1 putative T1SS secreted agglutinin RTX [Dickeya phage vB_DsoM_JA33]AYD79888.1 putative T1SS secreted agglutinin RTX [Dickeya phage vB_DsoM_JA11]